MWTENIKFIIIYEEFGYFMFIYVRLGLFMFASLFAGLSSLLKKDAARS